MNTNSRRQFLASGFLAAAGLAGHRASAAQAELPSRPAPLDSDLVFEMVRVSHFDLDRVSVLLEQEPSLVNAAWDWGGGDWERPLEAAAHIGRREIARHLLANGARQSLFASAMLGDRDAVLAAIVALPNIVNTRAPHGFTLLYHAAISGDVAIAEAIKPHLSNPENDCNQALRSAARDGHAEMAAWLLANGVTDPNWRNFEDKTPLTVATEKGFTKTAEVIQAGGGTE